jgi:hypothetical protein
MRTLLVAALVVLSVTEALAQRPSTLSMSCSQAQSLVARRGAVVLSTGRHTYDRFVASGGYCLYGEYADAAWAPTSDTRHCPLGYTCKSWPPPWRDRDFGPGSLFSD